MDSTERLTFPHCTVEVVRKKVKRPYVEVTTQSVFAVVHPDSSQAEIRSLVMQHYDWLRSKQFELREANDPSWRPETFSIGDLTFELRRRKKSGTRFSCTINTMNGNVIVTVPLDMPVEAVRALVTPLLEKLRAMRQAQMQALPAQLTYVSGEKHQLWGREYTLQVTEIPRGAGAVSEGVREEGDTLILRVRAGATAEQRREVMRFACKRCVEEELPALIQKYEAKMGVVVRGWSVRFMKTRWGSCTPQSATIRINSMLARHPKHVLECVLVHEMCHLFVRRHGACFYKTFDKYFPDWKEVTAFLNSAGQSIII